MPREKYKGVWIQNHDGDRKICSWCRSKDASYMIGVDTMISSNRIYICDSCGVMVQLFVEKQQSEMVRDFTTGMNLEGVKTGRWPSDRPNLANTPKGMANVEPKVDVLHYGDTLIVSPKNSSDMFEEYDDGRAEADEIAAAIRQGHTTVISRFPLNVQIIRRP
jgi:hypothetical protein